jgi:hypothetical protein
MTGRLRTTMQTRADALVPLDLDLDAIVRDGSRRLRRRLTALAGGSAALAMLVAGTAFGLHDRGSTAEPAPADYPGMPFTYAVGSVIHSGTSQVDVGVDVDSMVQTATGVVFADPQQRVYVEENGATHQIGQLGAAASHLVVGDDGSFVGWWDGRRFQLWPGPTGGTDSVDLGATTSDRPPSIRAIADSHVWFWNGTETWVATKPTTNAVYQIHGGLGSDSIQDAAAGKMLVQVGAEQGPAGLSVIDEITYPQGIDVAGLDPQVRNVSSGDLSPDGTHWFTDDSDQFAVFDSATGKRQDPTYRGLGFVFAAPYQWLDSDTMAVLALADTEVQHPRISLLTCHVSTNACQVTARDVGDETDVAIPVGESLRQ